MADFLPKTLHAFCAHSVTRVTQGLDQFIAEKIRMIGTGDPVVRKMYDEYVEPVREALRRANPQNAGSLSDQASAKFLDVELLDALLKNSRDTEVRNKLSFELLMISAGVGALSGVTPYTPAELQTLEAQNVSDDEVYEKVMTAYTFRHAMNVPLPYLSFFMTQLHLDSGNAGDALYDWESAFLFMLFLHAIWAGFDRLPREEQTYILQNYFYLSLVAGVPVRLFLEQLVRSESTPAGREEVNTFLTHSLDKNRETVPVDLLRDTGRLFVELFRVYLVAVPRGETTGGFEQGNFLNDLYGNQPGRDAYGAWLREAMAIMLHIQKKFWLK